MSDQTLSDQEKTGPSTTAGVPGADSLTEILSQPQFWGRCLEELEREGSLAHIRQPFRSASQWLFIIQLVDQTTTIRALLAAILAIGVLILVLQLGRMAGPRAATPA